MMSLARRLRQAGVLGLNRRNSQYISQYNPRRLYPLVDDKVLTKQLALEAGLAVPQLYAVIEAQHQVSSVPERVAQYDSFVIKPAHGSGGNGIAVIKGKRNNRLQLAGGSQATMTELLHHISGALSGLYSLGGHRDRVLIEYCVEPTDLFEPVSYAGVPDIRLIVLIGFPVMAMARFPTRQSRGKANLHQGAIGAGIDLTTGITVGGVQGNHPVSQHPDTGHSVEGLQIPGWDAILALASQAYELCGLGYIGVDLVLDRHLGPLMLELNARPGMNIQIANRTGLLKRLEFIEANAPERATTEERVAFVKQSFITH